MANDTQQYFTDVAPLNNKLYDYAVLLLQQGKSEEEVLDILAEKGNSQEDIQRVLVELQNPAPIAEVTRDNSALTTGLLWFGGGLAVTLVTYSMADSNGGGTYFVAWGPMVYGIIKLFQGLNR
jgi:hypothetical protein